MIVAARWCWRWSGRAAACCFIARRTTATIPIALLTGGIGHDEAIAAAAVRESAEETGLQVEIRRLVAVIDSTLRFGDIRLPFVSYVLHVVEAGGQLSADSHRGRRLS